MKRVFLCTLMSAIMLSFVFFAGSSHSQQTGSLVVTIQPQEVTPGGQWRLNGGGWLKSGTTLGYIPPGSHTVEFMGIPGWTQPATQTITISAGQTTQAQGVYQLTTGSLTVAMQPRDAVVEGAQWRLTTGRWISQATLCCLPPGSHTVEFMGIPGWTQPARQTITVTAGQTTQVQGVYQPTTGSLTVTIQPHDALAKGGQWRVGGGSWQASRATVSTLAPGNMTVEFKDLTGCIKPGIHNVTISAGQTTQTNGVYQRTTGFLLVTLQPMEVWDKGAQWRIGNGPWQKSGATVSNMPVGRHKVEFKDVTGWIKPGAQDVTVTAGQVSQGMGIYRK